MIEKKEQPGEIYIPSDDEILACDRWEMLNARMKRFDGSLAETRVNATYSIQLEGGNFPYKAGWAQFIFERAARSIQASIRDSGLDKNVWDKDWKNLMNGDLAAAPALDTSERVCAKGHLMKDRGAYLKCPSCSSLQWKKSL